LGHFSLVEETVTKFKIFKPLGKSGSLKPFRKASLGTGSPSRRGRTNVNQLIQELDEEANSADGAALVIALKERTSFVYANDPERAKQLTSELDAGGLPVAIMR
jgi:hypothetical protein